MIGRILGARHRLVVGSARNLWNELYFRPVSTEGGGIYRGDNEDIGDKISGGFIGMYSQKDDGGDEQMYQEEDENIDEDEDKNEGVNGGGYEDEKNESPRGKQGKDQGIP